VLLHRKMWFKASEPERGREDERKVTDSSRKGLRLEGRRKMRLLNDNLNKLCKCSKCKFNSLTREEIGEQRVEEEEERSWDREHKIEFISFCGYFAAAFLVCLEVAQLERKYSNFKQLCMFNIPCFLSRSLSVNTLRPTQCNTYLTLSGTTKLPARHTQIGRTTN
jgi:hypothetical protein